MVQQTPVESGSRIRRSLEDFPSRSLAGELLGITNRGHGAYVETTSVTVGRRDGSWLTKETYTVTLAVPVADAHEEFEQSLCVPAGYAADEAIWEVTAGECSLGEFLCQVASEQGAWQALTDRGRSALWQAGYHPAEYVIEESVDQ